MTYCAIDFGTSNSAVAISTAAGMKLVPLEGNHLTMPTAVFYCTDRDDLPPGAHPAPANSEPPLARSFGRAAVQAYMDGYGGRLMRSMKSILGSALVDQTTEVGEGYGVKYLDIITTYMRHLRDKAQAAAGHDITQVVLGRPVYFVDEDPERDAQAEASLRAAANAVGFTDVSFQYEPIAAAFDYEQQVEREQKVLVADIGGGTSDFSVVRVGPERMRHLDRRSDILANHGIHIAGTDFDRHVSLNSIMPVLGYGAYGPSIAGAEPRPVPSRVYFDLSTWHLINTVYQPARTAELKNMGGFYGEPVHHTRLMKVINDLVNAGWLASTRGRGGGVRLAVPASEINVGAVIRHTEDDFDLVGCSSCIILPACGLTSVLDEALGAFMTVLDRYTLADVLAHHAQGDDGPPAE